MNITIAAYDNFGEITSIRYIPDSEKGLYDPCIVLVEKGVTRDTHFVENGALVEKSPKPSNFHEFDPQSKSWVLPEYADSEIKQREQETVKLTANNTSNGPILFEGKLIDADVNARENIRNTIDRLTYEQEQGLFSGNLFWIDAENNTLDWSDASAYLAWLKRLHIAIANRKTGLVLTAKAEKDHIKTANAADLVMVKAKGKG
jgi:hypothetical protein